MTDLQHSRSWIAICLIGLILGLLAVGVVSGTLVRHTIQVLPAVVAWGLVSRGAPWASWAAAPIFAFWLLIMVAIWLFLLGVARIVTGHYSPTEIFLTFVIGASSLLGLWQTLRSRSTSQLATRAGWALAFAALQLAAMWLSLQPAVASI